MMSMPPEFTGSCNMGFDPFLPSDVPAVDPRFDGSGLTPLGGGMFDVFSPPVMAGNGGGGGSDGFSTVSGECERGVKRMKMDAGHRIGFRTKSEVEILDDGFKWRKYGKKLVKNSPNPRNYYRCSSEGCGVKKRIERDREDPQYVITTYEGVHNHSSPGTVMYCNFGEHHRFGVTGWITPNALSTVQSADYSC